MNLQHPINNPNPVQYFITRADVLFIVINFYLVLTSITY